MKTDLMLNDHVSLINPEVNRFIKCRDNLRLVTIENFSPVAQVRCNDCGRTYRVFKSNVEKVKKND